MTYLSVLLHFSLGRGSSTTISSPRGFVCGLAILSLSVAVFAGTPLENGTAKTVAPLIEDIEWTELWEEVATEAPGYSAKNKLNPTARADLAQAFYRKHPKDPRANEARKLEAIDLARAVFSGDTTASKRRDDSVNAFLKDATVPEALKAQVAGQTGFFDVLKASKTQSETWLNLAKHAQNLIQHYPNQPQGYETLLTVASCVEPKLGKRLAKELSESSGPPEVKVRARALYDRFGLLGRSLPDILVKTIDLEHGSQWKRDKPTLLFTWSVAAPDSVSLAQAFGQLDQSKVNVVFLNLDTDVSTAKDTAKGWIGSGIYDKKGGAGDMASVLAADQSSLLFVADADGLVSDVQGIQDVGTKLAKFSR